VIRYGLIAGCICSVAFGACVRIEGEHIAAKDLAGVVPAFASIPADSAIGLAPAPGLRRNLSAAELSRIAQGLGASAAITEGICVEGASELLTEARLIAAIEPVLSRPDVQIDIVDFSRYPVPIGELEFALSGLPRPSSSRPDAPVVWRGRVKYGGRRTMTIWASVRISSEGSWVEAATPIPANAEIRADQVALKSGRVYGLQAKPITDVSELIGRRLARSARAGQRITADMIGTQRDVEPGDTVQVSVKSGPAMLRFDARAETGGKTEQHVFVSMPNGRRISAVVVAKGKVLLDVDNQSVAAAHGSSDGDARDIARSARP
jgi:flagella basal body P-ring formation protein FlgA